MKVQVATDNERDEEIEITVDGRWGVSMVVPGRNTKIVLRRPPFQAPTEPVLEADQCPRCFRRGKWDGQTCGHCYEGADRG